jgi:hypothetical protein
MVARYLFRLGCRASAQPVEKPLSLRRRLLDSPIVYATSDQASLLNMLKAYLVAKLDRRGLIRYAKIGVFQQAGRPYSDTSRAGERACGEGGTAVGPRASMMRCHRPCLHHRR